MSKRRNVLVAPRVGSWAPQVKAVLDLATAEARELNHTWVGIDHLLLAMFREDCPGLAPYVFRAFGLDRDELRDAWVASMGDPFEPSDRWISIPPMTQLVLERANLKALELGADEVRSEHVLLAIGDSWGDSWMTRYLGESPSHVPTTVARPNLELATSLARHDPNRRQPWGSAVF